jgi:hypothetical protein
MGKTTKGIKTGFSVVGAIKNKIDHNKFENQITRTQKMAMFSNLESSGVSSRVSNLNGKLNRAWDYIRQNFKNLQRIFYFHNKLVEKHNSLYKKVTEQQKQIDDLNQQLKTPKYK